DDAFEGDETRRGKAGRVGRQKEELGADGSDQAADGMALVAAEVVHDDDIAGSPGRQQHLVDIARKLSPLIGPSMTQGASMRSQRSAAKKVSVRQRLCGTLATRRRPRSERPWRRVMLVLAQVSSMNTRRRTPSWL